MKRDFRPQMFPKYLPQLAIVSVEGEQGFTERLTGSTVSEVLRLNTGDAPFVAPSDKNISKVVHNILGKANKAKGPMYFEGILEPQTSISVNFSALVLPFSYEAEADRMDSLLLAFEFNRIRPEGPIC